MSPADLIDLLNYGAGSPAEQLVLAKKLVAVLEEEVGRERLEALWAEQAARESYARLLASLQAGAEVD